MATPLNDNAGDQSLSKAAANQQRFQSQRGEGYPTGTKTFFQKVDLATGDLTLNNTVPLVVLPTVPSGLYLEHLRFKVDDLDSNVSPAAKLDIAAYDSTGASVVTLISQSTKAQAGGSDELDLDIDPTLLDVSGLTLKLKVQTAPATAQAGSLYIYGRLNFSVIKTF